MNIKLIRRNIVILIAQLIFLCSCGTRHLVAMSQQDTAIPVKGKIAEIVERGTILIGTTGDYRPLSFCEADGTYWGFGIEVAKEIAKRIGVGVEFRKTSWPTLTADVLAEPKKFDLAIGGITITDARCKTMLMSEGYLANGKTILCRALEADRYKSLADIDKPEVRVMVNPGGLNEKFANENLTHAIIIVHPKNEEIPSLIAKGEADVMITEITEAPYYVQTDTRLAAPLLNTPFNHGEIGVLMQKGQEDLLQIVNATIRQMKEDGSLRKLHEKYGLVYSVVPDTLSTLRNQIDEVDSLFVDLLAKRMRISREIGQFKKVHGMSIVHSNRFNEILEKRCSQGTSLGIDSACVKSIFEAIHQESLNQQREITNHRENIKMKRSFKSTAWLLPQPVLIISTYDKEGKPNAMNAAWGGQWDMNEIIISLGSHQTTDNLAVNPEFTVAFATAETMVASDYVGIVSGRNTPDKMEKTGWSIEKAPNVKAPLFKEFPMTLECRVKQKIDESETGYYLVAEIVNILCDEKYLAEDGKPDVEKMELITFDPVHHTYIQLGKTVGKAFSDGKQLK